MATPSKSLKTQRPDLGMFVEFDLMRNLMGFVAYRVLPILDVRQQADSFGRIPTEQLGKLANVTRTSSGGYNRIKFTFEDDQYATKEYGLESPVDNRNARIYSNYLDAFRGATALVMHNVLAQAEKRVADAIMNASTFNETNAAVAWTTHATSKPITDVKAASQRVRAKIGQYANAAVLTRKAFRDVQESAQIHERIAAFGAGDKIKPSDITASMIAACFDVEEVIVADSSYDSAAEGVATTFSDIWDSTKCWVGRVARTRSIEEVCVGRTFHWAGDGSRPRGRVEEYYEESVRGKVVRCRHEVHEKLIYPEAGELIDLTAA